MATRRTAIRQLAPPRVVLALPLGFVEPCGISRGVET
jgi:hypothetical protein